MVQHAAQTGKTSGGYYLPWAALPALEGFLSENFDACCFQWVPYERESWRGVMQTADCDFTFAVYELPRCSNVQHDNKVRTYGIFA